MKPRETKEHDRAAPQSLRFLSDVLLQHKARLRQAVEGEESKRYELDTQPVSHSDEISAKIISSACSIRPRKSWEKGAAHGGKKAQPSPIHSSSSSIEKIACGSSMAADGGKGKRRERRSLWIRITLDSRGRGGQKNKKKEKGKKRREEGWPQCQGIRERHAIRPSQKAKRMWGNKEGADLNGRPGIKSIGERKTHKHGNNTAKSTTKQTKTGNSKQKFQSPSKY